ncbi:hypothetical protein ANN_07030 [Periplaneta americana]|uniref:Uncharacterized protein n=1 Tax=Periplaneta americana TaxID=6978 RepID=A0ABQ8TFT7_PERAM|nr:hypothetical protein ANN_07030 [Periplaneta americana]
MQETASEYERGKRRTSKYAKGKWKGRVGVSLKDMVSNTALQKITASENITEKALITKWKWGGHVARQQQGRWGEKPPCGTRT